MAKFMSRRRLTAEKRAELRAELQQRIAILMDLAKFNLKLLASRHGVPYHVVWRMDRTMQLQKIAQNVQQTNRE